MTFTGPKCPQANEEESEYPQAVEEILKNIGYRYGVTKAGIVHNKLLNKTTVSLEVKNYGVAPMYSEWPLCLYVVDEAGEVVARYETDVDLTKVCGGTVTKTKLQIEENVCKGTGLRVAAGIENPENGEPSVQLDMVAQCIGQMYILNVD